MCMLNILVNSLWGKVVIGFEYMFKCIGLMSMVFS